MIRAFTIIFACLASAELLIHMTAIKLPPSILGLLFLFTLLQTGKVKAEWFKPITDFLMQNLMLFIIPPCVALVQYLDLLAKDAWVIVISSFTSSLLVLFATAKTHEWLRKRQAHSQANKESK
ncbi:CidA/LrgA family protein [Alysiella filiformis]|uniref:Holin-like protein n=1 Tax=Alysiella filiformis DSM 16848 TaxID=1120981 RepID=A0A286E2J1_9NEIS|nr:CidA/LrgA family protein [Alysiella filiformis]QMT30911.1 CidA/LrgA family protein [Alysiella filiformis]UBQ56103.1 CidA/LrgA family protein [Alysiella filiformis DSM 16848]SOD65113.1 holin-like protein [Alysiella filiformis DSM 16848]